LLAILGDYNGRTIKKWFIRILFWLYQSYQVLIVLQIDCFNQILIFDANYFLCMYAFMCISTTQRQHHIVTWKIAELALNNNHPPSHTYMIHDVDVTCFELGLWCSTPLSTVFMYGNVFLIVYSQERTGEKMNQFLIVLPF
jgi:hypothetical protein